MLQARLRGLSDLTLEDHRSSINEDPPASSSSVDPGEDPLPVRSAAASPDPSKAHPSTETTAPCADEREGRETVPLDAARATDTTAPPSLLSPLPTSALIPTSFSVLLSGRMEGIATRPATPERPWPSADLPQSSCNSHQQSSKGTAARLRATVSESSLEKRDIRQAPAAQEDDVPDSEFEADSTGTPAAPESARGANGTGTKHRRGGQHRSPNYSGESNCAVLPLGGSSASANPFFQGLGLATIASNAARFYPVVETQPWSGYVPPPQYLPVPVDSRPYDPPHPRDLMHSGVGRAGGFPAAPPSGYASPTPSWPQAQLPPSHVAYAPPGVGFQHLGPYFDTHQLVPTFDSPMIALDGYAMQAASGLQSADGTFPAHFGNAEQYAPGPNGPAGSYDPAPPANG